MKFFPHFLVLSVFCALIPFTFAEDRSGRKEIKEIVLSGSGYERGLQHGRQLKQDIASIVQLWKENTARTLNQDPEKVLAEFFEYAHFEEPIRKWTPELYEEVRGIAEGSGQRFEDIFILNLLDEFWVFVDAREKHHCSGLGVPGSNQRPAFLAQNMDLETYTDGFQVLFRIPRQGTTPEQLILSHAGLIGLNGMNETGIGVCVNTLMQLAASSRGLPVAFVVRGLVEKSGKTDILRFIQEIDHASGQNYIIGIGNEVFDFEASANKVFRFDPEGTGGMVFHTNHALVNTDLKPWYREQAVYSENSEARLEAVRKRLITNHFEGPDTVPDILRSKDDPVDAVCRTKTKDSPFFTFASVIMTLGEAPFLQITPGPPDESEYQVIRFVR